ncbi:MAG: pyruvate ferredoxin oxidoreductase [Candidatus Ranarchaeia archaeon]
MSVDQKLVGLNGDEAVAYAAKQADIDVIAAYPITPQTIIVEKFSEFVADGEVETEFVSVESEHSAMSACIGASAAGARAFTATASNGLQLMDEVCYIAAGLRLPIVMAVASRTVSAPINIHCDHSDSMNLRDAGWIQIHTEDPQEAYDTTIQAFRIAEHPDVQLPVMVMLDGFLVSHTLSNVYMLSDNTVKQFVGTRKLVQTRNHLGKDVPYRLDPQNSITMGAVAFHDFHFEIKRSQIGAMNNASRIIKEINNEFAEISGRRYGNGLFEPYMLEDAETAIIVMASTAGTTKHVVNKLRKQGKKIGLLRIRAFRPFAHNEIAQHLKHLKAIAVMDRSISFGSYGPLFTEIRNAMYDLNHRVPIVNYIFGIGGRDTPPNLIEEICKETQIIADTGETGDLLRYKGVRG